MTTSSHKNRRTSGSVHSAQSASTSSSPAGVNRRRAVTKRGCICGRAKISESDSDTEPGFVDLKRVAGVDVRRDAARTDLLVAIPDIYGERSALEEHADPAAEHRLVGVHELQPGVHERIES